MNALNPITRDLDGIQVTLHYYCLPRRKNASYAAEDIRLTVWLPIPPSSGMWLKATPEGDYVEVADVYIDTTPGGEGITVFLEEPDDERLLLPWKTMKAEGWQLTDGREGNHYG